MYGKNEALDAALNPDLCLQHAYNVELVCVFHSCFITKYLPTNYAVLRQVHLEALAKLARAGWLRSEAEDGWGQTLRDGQLKLHC